jgi:citrate/tricarballylate utilization protein
MQQLDTLVREAESLGSSETFGLRAETSAQDIAEVARVLQICNACRYCEGFCAVFPAMTRRLTFNKNDVHFLANLCHNCGACLHACQYAPPHEFAVNVPRAMARVRARTYTEFAWPAAFGELYSRAGVTVSVSVAIGVILFLLLTLATHGSMWGTVEGSNFYAIFPHNLLAGIFGALFAFDLIAFSIGVRRFWRSDVPGDIGVAAAGEAVHSVLTLRYLGGGHGDGCNNEDDAFSLARRRFHHLTFYGFLLCFAATCTATAYHYLLGYEAPYPLFSVPVVLGTIGGVGLVVGPLGLLWLNLKRNSLQGDPKQRPMDLGFIVLLLLISLTGLGLLVCRAGPGMPVALAMHLGFVFAFFGTLPYNKFAHGVFRSVALLKWAVEKRRPSKIALGSD